MRAIFRPVIPLVLLCAALLLIATNAASCSDGVTLTRDIVSGAAVCVISVDLNDPSVKVDIGLPEKGIPHSETFGRFVTRHAPLAAVTGTYFDTRTLLPTGSIVVNGRTVHESHIGTAVCFTPDNKVRFVDAKFGEPCDLSRAECGIRTGPRLLANGEYALNARREGFRHPGLFGARTRVALGVTAGNSLLLAYVGTPVTFSRLAGIMKSLGAVDAVCLDGGTSSAMYYQGRVVHSPGRMLTNIVEVRRRTLSPTVAMLLASAPRSQRIIIRISAQWQAGASATLATNGHRERSCETTYEQAAVLVDPGKLRFAKGLHSLFPINRA